MVWVIPFCSPVEDLNRWLGTQKLSGVDRSAQPRQVHIKSPRIHLHTSPNPTCSRWYDHEWLKADYKPDSPPPTPTPTPTPPRTSCWTWHVSIRAVGLREFAFGSIGQIHSRALPSFISMPARAEWLWHNLVSPAELNRTDRVIL